MKIEYFQQPHRNEAGNVVFEGRVLYAGRFIAHCQNDGLSPTDIITAGMHEQRIKSLEEEAGMALIDAVNKQALLDVQAGT